jgi:microsomal dipeptidase-like Zn-dependent dipeptidase
VTGDRRRHELLQCIPSVAIPEELKRRGYSAADIRKIMGENLMRVFADVERVPKEMKK